MQKLNEFINKHYRTIGLVLLFAIFLSSVICTISTLQTQSKFKKFKKHMKRDYNEVEQNLDEARYSETSSANDGIISTADDKSQRVNKEEPKGERTEGDKKDKKDKKHHRHNKE